MRYYEQRYPEVDELVMVQVRQIAEMGAYVKLVSIARKTVTLRYSDRSDYKFGSDLALTIVLCLARV